MLHKDTNIAKVNFYLQVMKISSDRKQKMDTFSKRVRIVHIHALVHV